MFLSNFDTYFVQHTTLTQPTILLKLTQEPDILLSTREDEIKAVQSFGCGQAGQRIILPWNLLRENSNKTAKLLVKEWAKYRYGVFDDHGFAQDPLYPIYYESEGKILPTGSTNHMLTGSWIHVNDSSLCDPTSEECYFRPEGSNSEITCSLNYVPFLESVNGWCDKVGGPSKHSVLCQAKSVKSVIMSHSDFRSRSPRALSDVSVSKPVFNIVRQPKPKYVILIETSRTMSSVWKWVRKALKTVIKYELPNDTEIGIVSFSSEGEVRHGVSPLANEKVRSRLGDSIPDSVYRLSKTEDRCVLCAVKEAMEKLLRGREEGSHLIVLTQGDRNSLTRTEQEILTEYSNYHGVSVSSILLPSKQQPTLRYYNDLAMTSGGLSKDMNMLEAPMQILERLTRAILDIFALNSHNSKLLPVTIHRALIDTSSWSSEGEFIIDKTVGRNTLFGVYVEDTENHQIKSIKLTDQEGSVFGPFTKMSSMLDGINLKTINFPIGQKQPFDDVRYSS